jgi:hypothetical protein
MEISTMKNKMKLMLFPILMLLATSAWSASAVMVYTCEQDDDASEADVNAHAAEWLKAAKTMKHGANLEVRVMYPMAVKMPDDSDFMFVVTAPSFAEWGAFMDNYEGSKVAEADKKFVDIAVCPDSALWEEVKVK